jgi:hypothetical protein
MRLSTHKWVLYPSGDHSPRAQSSDCPPSETWVGAGDSFLLL